VTLSLVLVEAALELVPAEILGHPSVRRNAKRRGKRPEETLLDRSLHHYAMTGLPGQEKRGRPDILHFCLLEAMGSPLNRSGNLRVWVSTQRGRLIEVDPSTRPPRDCNRSKSLMERVRGRAESKQGGCAHQSRCSQLLRRRCRGAVRLREPGGFHRSLPEWPHGGGDSGAGG